MARAHLAPLSELDDWQLEHEEQDLRGRPLLGEDGRPVGRVDEMIVDTEQERVIAIRLDNGREYPTTAFQIRDERAILLPAAEAARTTAIPLVEERLRVHKRPVQVGQVEIRKEVETEQKTVEVPLMREEVHVERREVEPYPVEGEIRPDGDTIRVPIMGEEALVEKQPVVTGEVVVSKEPVVETEEVSATLRRTDVEVDREDAPAGTARGRPG